MPWEDIRNPDNPDEEPTYEELYEDYGRLIKSFNSEEEHSTYLMGEVGGRDDEIGREKNIKDIFIRRIKAVRQKLVQAHQNGNLTLPQLKAVLLNIYQNDLSTKESE